MGQMMQNAGGMIADAEPGGDVDRALGNEGRICTGEAMVLL